MFSSNILKVPKSDIGMIYKLIPFYTTIIPIIPVIVIICVPINPATMYFIKIDVAHTSFPVWQPTATLQAKNKLIWIVTLGCQVTSNPEIILSVSVPQWLPSSGSAVSTSPTHTDIATLTLGWLCHDLLRPL